jgi:hypothetical protein
MLESLERGFKIGKIEKENPFVLVGQQKGCVFFIHNGYLT